jgi:hypothetical protein
MASSPKPNTCPRDAAIGKDPPEVKARVFKAVVGAVQGIVVELWLDGHLRHSGALYDKGVGKPLGAIGIPVGLGAGLPAAFPIRAETVGHSRQGQQLAGFGSINHYPRQGFSLPLGRRLKVQDLLIPVLRGLPAVEVQKIAREIPPLLRRDASVLGEVADSHYPADLVALNLQVLHHCLRK